MQSEKLINSLNIDDNRPIQEENLINIDNITSKNKPRAPVLAINGESVENQELDLNKENLEPIELVLCDTNKEKMKNSVKVSILVFNLHV